MNAYSTIPEVDKCLSDMFMVLSRSRPDRILNDWADYEDLQSDLYRVGKKYPEEIIRVYKERSGSMLGDMQNHLIWSLRGVAQNNVEEFSKEIALNHKDWDKRWYAASVLSEMKGPDIIEEFVLMLDDPDRSVLFKSVSYLEKHGDERALGKLNEIIKDVGLQKTSPGLIDAAHRAIRRINEEDGQ